MKEEYKKYLPVIGLVVCGGLLLIMIISNFSGSVTSGGSGKTYQKSLSLDKLYDEAGGNDPLSDSIMTNQTDLSTENFSCSFMTTYKGIKDRSVKCMKGCNDDESDENSNFCKQFEYPGGDDKLQDVFLDQTYTRRRGSRKIEAIEESGGNPCQNYPLRGDDTGDEIMKCSEGGERATAECLGEPFDGTNENYSNDCFGYDSSEKKFYNCETESDGSGNKILVQGEACDYQPECDKMKGNLDGKWVLQTKRYMNEIRKECEDDGIKRGREVERNTSAAESEKVKLKRLMIAQIITSIIVVFLIIYMFYHLFIKNNVWGRVGKLLIIIIPIIYAAPVITFNIIKFKNKKLFNIIMLTINSLLIVINIILIPYYINKGGSDNVSGDGDGL